MPGRGSEQHEAGALTDVFWEWLEGGPAGCHSADLGGMLGGAGEVHRAGT